MHWTPRTGYIEVPYGAPRGGHGYPLQYSCLENHMDRGALQARIHRVARSLTWLKWLHMPCCCCSVTSVVSSSVRHYGLQPARLLCTWDSPGKNTEVGSYALLQGIFLTQKLNPDLLPCRQILYGWITKELLYFLSNTLGLSVCILKKPQFFYFRLLL